MAVLIFSGSKVHWMQICFLYRALYSLHDNFIFFSLKEIWNINKPILEYLCHYASSKRKTKLFRQERHRFKWRWFLELSACATSFRCRYASLLCAGINCLWHVIHQRVTFFRPTPGACRIWHMQCWLCTCNSLTCIPMIHTVLSRQTMPLRLLNLIFPLCALLTENSSAGPCNEVQITAVKNIPDALFFLSMRLNHFLDTRAWDVVSMLRTECVRLSLPVVQHQASPRVEIIVAPTLPINS